jgi:beta-glucanase (GH16 family)
MRSSINSNRYKMRRALRMGFTCLLVVVVCFGRMNAQTLDWRQRLQPVNLPAHYPSCPEHDQYVTVVADDFDKGYLDQWFWDANILGFNHTPNSIHTKEWCSISSLSFPPNTGLMRIHATADPIDTTGIGWMPPGELLLDNLPNRRVWPYQSGALTSKWALEKGRYILRAQMTPGKDTWPAFWLFGDCADEIDIIEFMQQDKDERHDRWISHSVHTELVCGDGINPDTKGYNLKQDMTTALHTYGVEWDDFRIRFFTDGVVRRTFYHYYRRRSFAGIVSYKGVNNCDEIDPSETYREDPQFSNAMLKVIINLAIRNVAVATDYPKQMDVEYFKHSDLMDCDETKTLRTQADIAGANFYASYGDRSVTAGEVIIDPQSTMSINGPLPTASWNPGDLLIVTAAEEIRILPGFEVQRKGNFVGQIKPCTQANKMPDENNRFLPETEAPEWSYWGDSLIAFPQGLFPTNDGAANTIRLFPNPATVQVQLLGTEFGDEILVHDLLGRSLGLQPMAKDRTSSIAIDGLAPGIYLVEIRREGLPIGKLRFVKE